MMMTESKNASLAQPTDGLESTDVIIIQVVVVVIASDRSDSIHCINMNRYQN